MYEEYVEYGQVKIYYVQGIKVFWRNVALILLQFICDEIIQKRTIKVGFFLIRLCMVDETKKKNSFEDLQLNEKIKENEEIINKQ